MAYAIRNIEESKEHFRNNINLEWAVTKGYKRKIKEAKEVEEWQLKENWNKHNNNINNKHYKKFFSLRV